MMTSAFKLFRPCQVFCALLLFLLSGQAWSQCGPLPSPALTANQWSLVSLPCMPTTMTVDGVWGDELGTTNYDATWVVYERDEINDSYTKLMINSPVNQDAAYWVLSLAGASWNLDGTPTPLVAGSLGCPTANCYEIPLVPPGNPGEMRYNMVGFPYPILIPWQDVHVRTDGLGVLNPSEAQALNVLSNTFWIWNGNAYEVANDVTPGMMGVLQPYAGMFVETRDGAIGQNPVLLIPESAVNDLPDAATDNLTVLEGGSQTVLDSTQTSVLDNDSDREGQPLVVMASPPAVLPTPPTNGMVTLNTPGTFQYDHDGGETTADTFDYTVCEDTAPFQCSNGTVDVVITPVNDAPALGAVGDQMIDELANLNFTATSTDPDVPADALAFSLSGVVPTGAAISPMGVFNFTPTEAQGPGSFTFDVVVMDNGVPVMSDNETITVTVNEVNVAPTVTNQTLGPVSETAADTAVVGTVAATDPDVPANTLMFSITGANPGNAFAIDGSGQITVNDTDAIDFDTPPLAGPSRFELTVEVDDGAAQPTAVVTINLTDVAPSISNTAFTIAEDIADTTVVGSVPNSGDTNGLTYSFTGGSNAGGAFAIDSDGQITVNDTSAIDFENPPLAGPARFALAVMVTDGTTADTATVTVNLTDIDEPPVLNLDDDDNGGGEPNFAATFNTSIGNPIPIVDGSLSATDPDTGAMISSATVTITNVQDMPNELLSVVASGAIVSGDISFNASTGVLTINRVAPLSDYQTVLRTLTYDNNAAAPTLSPARSITAVINDGANNSAAVTSTVTLVAGPTLDLDDDNSTAAGNNFSGAFTEGSAAAAADTDVTITAPTINLASATATLTNRLDGDANEALAATASGGILAGDITYTPATGVLSIAPAAPQLVADFEAVLESLTYNNTDDVPTETDRIIHVTVTDTNTSTSEVAVSTLSVTAVNDPPGVADKSYNATGNVQISVPDGADDLLNGATDPEGDTPITINSFQGTSANGGTVTANTTTGAFTYDPPAGFTGDDTFTYTLTDDGGTTVSGNITVTVTVADLIWFIDDNPAQTGNDGTLTNPFTTLAAFDTANGSGGTNPAVGQCIFLHSGSYTGGVTLLNNQRLLGQGASGSLASLCSITLAANSMNLPVLGGTNPTIANAGGNGVTLASGNTIRGLDVGQSTGTGLSGTSVGNLLVTDVAIDTGAGVGVNINGGALDITLGSVSVNNATNAIALTNTTGTFTVNGAVTTTADSTALSLDGATNTTNINLTSIDITGLTTNNGIDINNFAGTLTVLGGTINYMGPGDAIEITETGAGTGAGNITIDTNLAAAAAVGGAGFAVDIDGLRGGTVDFGGTFTDTVFGNIGAIRVRNMNAGAATTVDFTGTVQVNSGGAEAIDLDNNDLSTISFTSGLDLDTTSGTALRAVNGGTVNVQGSGNTIDTGTGQAININNTTIGGLGVTFQSISVNGASSGIVLTNTGTLGGLTVTGDGTNTTQGGNASGGLIQNTTSTAIAINQSHELNLARMRILTPGGNGILADQLTGQGGIAHTTIEDVDVSNTSGLFIRNDNTNLNVGSGFTVDNSIFRNAATGQVMFLVEGRGTSVMNITVEDSLFTDLVPDAYQHSAGLDPSDNGTITTVFRNNTVRDARAVVGSSVINIGKAHSANSNFTISGNTIQNVGIPGVNGGVINIAASAANVGGTITGTISGNRLEDIDGRRRGINIVPEPASGSVGTVDITIDNNDINDMTNGIAIFADIRENTPLTHLRVTNNRIGTGNFGTTVGNIGGTRDGVFIQGDDTQAKTVNVNFIDNTVHVTNVGSGTASDQAAVIKADNDNVTVNATVHGNTILQGAGGTGDFVFEAEGASTYCLDLNGANVVANANSALTGIVLEREAAATFHVEGMPVGPHNNATVEAFLDPRNNNHVLSPVGDGFTNNGGAGCPTPP